MIQKTKVVTVNDRANTITGCHILRDVRCREILDERIIVVVEIKGARGRGVGGSPSNR